MVSIDRTRVSHRGTAAIVTVVIFTGETCTPGRIVDFCRDLRGEAHGYLLDKGVFTTINAPGVAVTIPFGINNRGRIVGTYVDAGSTTGSAALKPSGNACGACLLSQLRGFWYKHIARNGLPSRFPRVMGNA
jgi:hypothetical protein